MAKNRVIDTSLKALKSIFIIFSLILFITACDLQQQEEKKQESDLCTIKLSLSSASDSEPSSRVTIPEINLSDLYYSFECMNATTSDIVFQTPSDGANGKTKEEIESLQIKIPMGNYEFGLSAYTDPSCSNESLVLQFTSDPLFINPTLGTFTLNCQLSELAIATGIGTGTIDIRLEIPPLADVTNVKLDLIKINGDGTTNYIMTDQNFEKSWEDGKQIMSFSKDDCERGDYLAKIRAQDSNFNFSPAVGELFHVAKGFTSRSNNNIDISYNLKYERYVSSEGDDDNGNGSFRAPFKTIERAVESINSFNMTSQQWSIILASDLTLTEAAVIEGTVNAKNLILTSHVPEGESSKSLIGSGSDTVLYYSSSIPLEIKNIQIRGGRVPSTSGKKNDNGGGLYIGNGSTRCYVSLSDNAVICDNVAVQGGGLYISNNSYLYVSGSAVIGRDSTTCSTESAYSNLATGNGSNGGGGGIYCADNGHLYLGYYKEGTFSPYEREFTGSISYNRSISNTYSGGGIYVAENGYLNISSGTIKYNSAKAQGGGICVRTCKSDTHLKISNLTLLSNQASTGGGIGVNNTNFTFENCTFESNYAASHGGACYFDITGLNAFHDCQIYKNSATTNGGGIYLYGNTSTSGATPRICLYGNTQIGRTGGGNGNSAQAGGGVYLAKGILAVGAKTVTVSGSTVETTLDDVTGIVAFESSATCPDGGGAIYCSAGTKLYLGPTAFFSVLPNVTNATNDIYMKENSSLYVNKQFTTTEQNFIAYIQPAANFYEDSTLQLLYLASNSSITIADVKNRFKIHPRSSTETNWSLNDSGCIVSN